jgi:trk system potassium uptake protein
LVLVGGFGAMIFVGTCLLMLPVSSSEREWTSPVIALFVATSAVCVTGLVPVDTATHWSPFGQAVILVLIQLGGFGFMTSTTLLFLLFGWRVGIRERIFLSESLDLTQMGGVVRLTRRAVIFTAIIEVIGFVILTARFGMDEPFGRAVWWGLFHSVSAFNNAGFDVTGNFRSLEDHADPVTLLTVSTMVILGGLGFLVVEDLLRRRQTGLSVDSRVVLTTTALLLAVGFVVFLSLEWGSTLAGRSAADKVLQSWFHSVTPRTAGFSSLPVAEMNESTRFFTMVLMFIGGGSGSTAGGIKVGTLAIVVIAALSTMRGREHSEVAGREVRRPDIDRAIAVMLLGAALIFVVSLVLSSMEGEEFFAILFETTSAFGTVGLSEGITPELSDPALVLVTAMMFIGRLGPLTLVLALLQRTRPERRRLPEERIRIG